LLRQEMGEKEKALAEYEKMRAIFAQLIADFPTVPEYHKGLSSGHNDAGILLTDAGRLKEAEDAYRDSIALDKQLMAEFRAEPSYRQGLATSHHNLGRLL